MTAVQDLELPDVQEPPGEPEPPKPASERTAVENQQAKADAIALALWRRRLHLRDIAHLPYSVRGKAPSLSRFARQAFREAGDVARYRQRWGTPPEQPPHSKDSPTWRMAADRLAAMHAFAAANPDDPRVPDRDLTGDATPWTLEAPCTTPTPGPSRAPSPAGTTSTTTTSTAAASTPKSSPTAGTGSATAAGDPVHDPEWRARRYARTLTGCAGCGTPVRWVTGPDGVLALHRDPDPDGRWLVDEDTLHARALHDGERPRGPRWADHASTCPARPMLRGQARAAALADGHARCESCHAPIPPEATAPRRKDGAQFTTCLSCDGPAAPPLPGQRFVLDDGRKARHRDRPARQAPRNTYRR